jgi:MFS family permease
MLWCISLFNYADRQAVFSVFPLLEKEMHLSSTQLGLLGSSFAWVYGLSGPLAGYVVDRIRRKTAVLAGLQIWSVICSATALSRTFPQLLFFRAAEGLGESIYYPASMSMVSDYHGKATRSRAMGIHQTSVYTGTIAGGFFAGLIGQVYGWRWSFVIFGGLGMLLGFVLQRFLIEPERGAADLADIQPSSTVHATSREVSHTPGSFMEFLRTAARTPSLLLLMGAFLCANFVAVVLLSWMPKFLYDKFHLGLAAAGLTATLFVQLASMAGSPLGGWMADRLRKRSPRGRMLVQFVGVLCGAPFVLLCGLTQSIGWLIFALTAWGFFKGLYDGNIWASTFDVIHPDRRGTTVGFMNAIGWIGGGSAPLIIGIIAERTSLSYAIAMASAVYIGAAALLLAGMLLFVDGDTARVQEELSQAPGSGVLR